MSALRPRPIATAREPSTTSLAPAPTANTPTSTSRAETATERRTTFAGSDAVVDVWISDGGPHEAGGTAFDLQPFARLFDFVLRFHRSGDALTADAAGPLTGAF